MKIAPANMVSAYQMVRDIEKSRLVAISKDINLILEDEGSCYFQKYIRELCKYRYTYSKSDELIYEGITVRNLQEGIDYLFEKYKERI